MGLRDHRFKGILVVHTCVIPESHDRVDMVGDALRRGQAVQTQQHWKCLLHVVHHSHYHLPGCASHWKADHSPVRVAKIITSGANERDAIRFGHQPTGGTFVKETLPLRPHHNGMQRTCVQQHSTAVVQLDQEGTSALPQLVDHTNSA